MARRITSRYDIVYFLGDKCHRLDGPAVETLPCNIKNYTDFDDWYVLGTIIHYFNYHMAKKTKKKDIPNILFNYIRIYPEFIKEIELLARHNNWLSEDQLMLLTTISIFNS